MLIGALAALMALSVSRGDGNILEEEADFRLLLLPHTPTSSSFFTILLHHRLLFFSVPPVRFPFTICYEVFSGNVNISHPSTFAQTLYFHPHKTSYTVGL